MQSSYFFLQLQRMGRDKHNDAENCGRLHHELRVYKKGFLFSLDAFFLAIHRPLKCLRALLQALSCGR